MKIILFGYRGSGKSTVGKQVADRLGWPLVDTDCEIVERFGGMTIAEIWEKHGEPAFREMESRVTEAVCKQDHCVISLGGGTLMQHDARMAVETSEQAARFYLSAPAEVLYKRITGDDGTAANRPALTSHGISLAEVKQVLEEREATYVSVSDHIIDVATDSIEEITEQIIEIMEAK